MFDKRPLKRKKLSELVEEELEFMIRKGIFQEGEHIPSERTLMEMFKVGRPSVREALATLRRKGLIEVNNGERTKVCRPTPFTLINELSGIARDYLASDEGMQHFEQLRLFFRVNVSQICFGLCKQGAKKINLIRLQTFVGNMLMIISTLFVQILTSIGFYLKSLKTLYLLLFIQH